MTMTVYIPSLVLIIAWFAGAPLHAAASEHADLKQGISQLSQQNSAMTEQLTEIDQKIAEEEARPGPEKMAFEQAQADQQAAKKALMETPSEANRQRMEKAKFAYLMAERKYRRANEQLLQLQSERQSVAQRIDTNTDKISELEQLKLAQQDTARKNQALAQEKAEQQRRQTAKAAQRKREAELKNARKQHAAALAEIERLKAQLVPKAGSGKKVEPKAGAKASKRTTGHAVAKQKNNRSSTRTHVRTMVKKKPAKKAKPSLTQAQWVRGGREQYWALMKTADKDKSRSRRRGDHKILQVQTYRDDRLLKQTSHSLKHLGNQLYQAKSIVRAGKTEFIIDSKRWVHLIPQSNNKDPFVFVLDARTPAKPKLMMFAKADVE